MQARASGLALRGCAARLLLTLAALSCTEARSPAKRFGAGGVGGVNSERPPYWLIVPFILIVVGFLVVMIYLIVADEKQDQRRRADEKKVSSLKFGRMDPRYHKD
ncbi:hypothetical protein T492DRAFT_893375 [Pavlovales sp. CCMP2436]|nr:hypothetical protein T492DRAFT_893375 [Pavlovales sp. CCMP2436]|mmetsp:Transcript_15653/g.39842  ORF Transcript_15653/g.39842 Transcript_15653/m.39842 type:complete len:105 (-) Transcript_15653:357-671(-)